MTNAQARVLDVGNCDPDHGMIDRMLLEHFDVSVDRVMFVEETLAAMRKTRYHLVLVNRLIFADGSDGMELHRRARLDPALCDMPIMLVSNFAEAQASAIAEGGVPGFGKAAIESATTADLLSKYLPAK